MEGIIFDNEEYLTKEKSLQKVDNLDKLLNDKDFNLRNIIKLALIASNENIQFDDELTSNISDRLHKTKLMLEHANYRDLFEAILVSNKPSIAFDFLRKSSVLDVFLPELLNGYGVMQNEYHAYDVYYHCVMSCDAAIPNLTIRISALLHDIGKPKSLNTILISGKPKNTFYNHEVISARITRSILRRFDYPKEFIDKVNKLIINHMFHYTDEWTDNAIRRFVRNVGQDLMPDLFLLREADRAGSGLKTGQSIKISELQNRINEVIEKDNAFSYKDLAINGNDIMEYLEINTGKVIGEILKYLLDIVIEDMSLNTKDHLLNLTKSYWEQLK